MSAGLISLISVYTVPWQLRLGYSSLDVNLISAAGNLGAYLAPPLLGILSDSHGPVVLSWLSFIGFVPSYLYLSYVFQTGSDPCFALSVAAFAVVGISTSALYFSALIACAKLYPDTKLLAISFPTTCFGLSSVIVLQVIKLPWFHCKEAGYLDLAIVFRTIAIFYTFVFVLTSISTSTISIIKLRNATDFALQSNRVVGTDEETAGESTLLLPRESEDEFYARIQNFFQDYVAYTFLAVMLLTMGVLEMFNTNMLSLTNLILGPGSSVNVLTQFAIFSTVSRLLSGLLIDLFTKWNWPRISLIIFMVCAALLAQFVVIRAMNTENTSYVAIASAMSGFTYGGLFTIFPALTLNLWGDEVFGTAYGTFMLGPALGSAFFGVTYARVHDSRCSSITLPSVTDSPTSSPTCIVPAFNTSAIALIVALTITIITTIRSKRLRSA
ncbi:unnamed protein product [Kluyveromyces dobzhanskii CBS 2104]|nr:unnamed protein product [Kluyveromyces dobzhanskii CBS 2104]